MGLFAKQQELSDIQSSDGDSENTNSVQEIITNKSNKNSKKRNVAGIRTKPLALSKFSNQDLSSLESES